MSVRTNFAAIAAASFMAVIASPAAAQPNSAGDGAARAQPHAGASSASIARASRPGQGATVYHRAAPRAETARAEPAPTNAPAGGTASSPPR